jgi:hypothetical protein
METEDYYHVHNIPPANLKLHILFQYYRFPYIPSVYNGYSQIALFLQGLGLNACGHFSPGPCISLLHASFFSNSLHNSFHSVIICLLQPNIELGSPVGIATSYGLDGWGSILNRDKRFFFPVYTESRSALGPNQLPDGYKDPFPVG